jgi:hypothetical protein
VSAAFDPSRSRRGSAGNNSVEKSGSVARAVLLGEGFCLAVASWVSDLSTGNKHGRSVSMLKGGRIIK